MTKFNSLRDYLRTKNDSQILELSVSDVVRLSNLASSLLSQGTFSGVCKVDCYHILILNDIDYTL